MKFLTIAVVLVVSVQSADTVPSVGATASTSGGNVLETRSSIEVLAEPTTLQLERTSSVTLEPGIRFAQTNGAVTFATHDGNKVVIEAGADRLLLPSPVTAHLTDRGWEFNGSRPVKATSLLARRGQGQDDADSNLKSMQDAAKKLNGKTPHREQKLRYRWLYGEDPFATAELFNSAAIQQLSHITPAGF